jgi:NADPH-dependent 2,4-dienoyl-CoA reductase/sulfur reductase-like enzyme
VIAFPQIALWLPGRWPAEEAGVLRSLDAVLDVMRVPASGDASVAVVPCPAVEGARGERCEILVVGGGTGGVAAALAAASAGRQVVLLEETDWLGGQLTAQGVSALDEHAHIETFGGTASYYRLRDLLRDAYRPRAGDAAGPPTSTRPLLGQPAGVRAAGRGRGDRRDA